MTENEETGFRIFGRDVLKIPCIRESFLYSMSSYIGVGLLTFLVTSKPKLSSHLGFASYIVVTLGYYTNCRINYANQKFQMAQIQQAMHKAAVMEGTEEEEIIKTKPMLEEV
ncbi:cytochrome c oxidase assembly protein COX20, mitochondrial [Nasonia vitripennis]|uniref:Cytochrome c oxidase assembly protein COX20, mitochondrial n=1 Tax=Nasonia vitripennis TaxID=7425 RepID=A0A7M7GAB3_NASVI|nr:cytochrome c oxidase assembly protein COX20, mitochondrial [Nasonia vitripennis]